MSAQPNPRPSRADADPSAPAAAAWWRDAVAAVVVSMVGLSLYLSAATLMFSGSLAVHLPVAIGAALVGSAVLSIAYAWRGSLPLAAAGVEPATVPVMAAITAGVAAGVAPAQALPTAVAAMAVTGLTVGAAWWSMGRHRWGDVIRYLPYPVIGGFLASVGWLLVTGGAGVVAGAGLSLPGAGAWFAAHGDLRLAVGVLVGVLLWWLPRRFPHALALPLSLLAFALLIHGGLAASGLGLDAAREAGWLLPTFERAWPMPPLEPTRVDWGVVLDQAGLIASAVIVATISLLLSDTSLEVTWDTRADLNRDLLTLGAGNALSGVCGGLIGGVSISRSLLNRSAGGHSRAGSLWQAGICLAAAGWGGQVVGLLPRPLLGGLLIALGLAMFRAWLVDSRRQLPARDYAIIVLMLAVTACFGFLPAVCVGVLVCCLDFALSSARLSPVRRVVDRSAWPSSVERSADEAACLAAAGRRYHIVELQGVLFFGSATRLVRRLEPMLAADLPPSRLLFDFHHVHGLDSSGAQALGRLFKQARARGIGIDLSHAVGPVLDALRLARAVGPDPVHADIDGAVRHWDDHVLAQAAVAHGTLRDELARTLPPHEAEQLLARFRRITLRAGEVLFRQGDPADALYLVESGWLAAVVDVDGHARTVRASSAGSAIGEMGLFRSLPRSATVRAEAPTVLLSLDRDRIEALERDEPALALALYRLFLSQMAGRIDQLTVQVGTLSR